MFEIDNNQEKKRKRRRWRTSPFTAEHKTQIYFCYILDFLIKPTRGNIKVYLYYTGNLISNWDHKQSRRVLVIILVVNVFFTTVPFSGLLKFG